MTTQQKGPIYRMIEERTKEGDIVTPGELLSILPKIQELESSSFGTWISVEDRLPELNEYVLAQFKNGCSVTLYHRTTEAFTIESELDELSGEVFPTHWMSLPSPPK